MKKRAYSGVCPACGTPWLTHTPDGRTNSINRICTCKTVVRLHRDKASDYPTTMTLEEQRITLLEYLGWTDLKRSGRRGEDGPVMALRGIPPGETKHVIAPNHPLSLREMHLVERMLTPKESADYAAWLKLIVKREWADLCEQLDLIPDWHATAAHRCEAFMRVRGIWKRQSTQ